MIIRSFRGAKGGPQIKRVLALLLAFAAAALILTGCKILPVADVPTEEPVATATNEPTAAPTPEPTEEPTPEPTEEPTPEPTDAPVEIPVEWDLPYEIKRCHEYNADAYPYIIETSSAIWYLASADIELIGEEKFFNDLKIALRFHEQDFLEAKEFLKDYLTMDISEVPKVKIITDFAALSEEANPNVAGAYYLEGPCKIKLLHDWDQVYDSLLHEYVHFLTLNCVNFKVRLGTWAEGIAEYISRFVCRNEMAHYYYSNLLDKASVENLKAMNVWDEDEDTLNVRILYYLYVLVQQTPQAVGLEYPSVTGAPVKLTESQQQHPLMSWISYHEACVLVDYLVEHFGTETVLRIDPDCESADLKDIYGKDFETLFKDCIGEIVAQYKLD